MENFLLSKIKEYTRMMEISGRKFNVTANDDGDILLLVPLDRVGHVQQPIYIEAKSTQVIKFSAPIPETFRKRNDIPKRLEKAVMERNKSQLFMEKWAIEELPEFFCFTLISIIPNSMLMDMSFLEKTIYGIIQECLWFYNNYELLARRLKVFISYAKEDYASAKNLYSKLTKEGINVWIDDEKLSGGKDWKLEIQKEIRDSHIVIVLLSENSISKTGFIQKEIRIALDYADEHPEGAVFLIPARLDDCEVPIKISERFQWVDLFKTNGFKKLLQSLSEKASTLGFSIDEAKKTQELNEKITEDNPVIDKIFGIDKHENTVHKLCVAYSQKEVDDNICLEIFSHLINTHRPARSTVEITEKLSFFFQIEIVALLLLMEHAKDKNENAIKDCLTVFKNSDSVIGQVLRYPLPPEKKESVLRAIGKDTSEFFEMLDDLPESQIEKHVRVMANDKNIYSFQSLLEFTLMEKRAFLKDDKKMQSMFNDIKKFIKYAISLQ